MIPDPGDFPQKGSEDVKIVLTDASLDILARVPELKRWKVAPPMTRGVKSAKAVAPKAVVKPRRSVKITKEKKEVEGFRARRLRGRKLKKLSKQEKKEKKEKKKKSNRDKTKAKMEDSTGEMHERSFGRDEAGRENIQTEMKQLHDLYCQAFPSRPAFNADGKLRLNFPGAENFSFKEMIHASGHAFQAMYPDMS